VWLAAAAIAVLAALACAGWLLWPREDKLGSVKQIQLQLLQAGSKPSRAAIDQLIRTVDRLDRRELGTAYRAAGEEWKRIEREAIDAYFQAAAADRPPLLDAHIARMRVFHELLAAMNPGSQPGSPVYLPRDRRGRNQQPPPAKSPAEAEADAARRQLATQFDAALQARAKSRGEPLPVFR